MPAKDYDISVTPLAGDADWLERRERFEGLEARCVPDPFVNWRYLRETWRTFTPESRCWLVEVADTAEAGRPLIAAAVLREHVLERRFLKPKALRSLDFVYFMRIPPFLAQRGREDLARRAMADALAPLRRASRADMLTLFRMDSAASDPWVAELRSRGIFVKKSVFTPAPQLHLGDDIEAFLRDKHSKVVRENARRERRIIDHWGEAPVMERFGSEDLPEQRFEEVVDRFEALYRKTWQFRWEEESGRVDHAVRDAFTRWAFALWRDRGELGISFLNITGRDVAFLVTLYAGGRLWWLMTGYDQDFKNYGVGKRIFVEGLRDAHGRGVRLFELGGEALGWKTEWATGQDEVYQIELTLGGWKGRLWSLAQRLKKRGRTE